MELNLIAAGVELVGTTIKSLTVRNSITDIEKEAKRSFGLSINEPHFEETEDGVFSQLTIDFEIEIKQSEEQKFKMELALEGAFLSEKGADSKNFKQLVAVNGAAAVISIARGKIETITSNIFNNGKITVPFVNVIDYYKSITE